MIVDNMFKYYNLHKSIINYYYYYYLVYFLFRIFPIAFGPLDVNIAFGGDDVPK